MCAHHSSLCLEELASDLVEDETTPLRSRLSSHLLWLSDVLQELVVAEEGSDASEVEQRVNDVLGRE